MIKLGVPHVLFHAMGVQRQVDPYDVTPDAKKFLLNSDNRKEDSEPMTLVQNWPEELRK